MCPTASGKKVLGLIGFRVDEVSSLGSSYT